MSTPQSPSLQSAEPDASPISQRQRHNTRDLNGKLVSKHIMSPEFLCRYIEWRKSRLALLPSTRKRDRGWYASLPWSQWLLEGIVKNENVPSMRTLAHIYDNIKNGSPIKGRLCAFQRPMHPARAQSILRSYYFLSANLFFPLQLRGWSPMRQFRSAQNVSSMPSIALTLRRPQPSMRQPPQSPRSRNSAKY
jgi:hypothetical protein